MDRETCRRQWLPTPVLLPGEAEEAGGLQAVEGHKESDRTERLTPTLLVGNV